MLLPQAWCFHQEYLHTLNVSTFFCSWCCLSELLRCNDRSYDSGWRMSSSSQAPRRLEAGDETCILRASSTFKKSYLRQYTSATPSWVCSGIYHGCWFLRLVRYTDREFPLLPSTLRHLSLDICPFHSLNVVLVSTLLDRASGNDFPRLLSVCLGSSQLMSKVTNDGSLPKWLGTHYSKDWRMHSAKSVA